MFLLAATTAVSAAMNAFYRMESLSRAIVVSDTILDKAQGELSLASADGALLCLGGESSGDELVKTICFYSANGNPVRMESEASGDGKGAFFAILLSCEERPFPSPEASLSMRTGFPFAE